MVWFALIIPLIISLGGYFLFEKKIVWWEMLLCTAASALIIFVTSLIVERTSLSDTEYKSYMVTEVRYYESYETWVDKTCTRQVRTGTDSNGNVTYRTESYDCSYCDEYPEKYKLYDSGGHEFKINENEYDSYVKLWKQTPQFVELNRKIKYKKRSLGNDCGKDGDMYKVNWNGELLTSVSTTLSNYYKNKLQTNNSAFNFEEIDDNRASKLGLYNYPPIGNYYQDAIMGLCDLKISMSEKDKIIKTVDYINGQLGSRHIVKIYFLLFKDSSIDIAIKQQSYWQGGNQNEICICLGTDDMGNIDWVYPFSWVKEKTLLVNLREDIIGLQNITNNTDLYSIIKNNVEKYWQCRDMDKDFEYLSFEFKIWQIILIYALTLIASLRIMYWCINNEYGN